MTHTEIARALMHEMQLDNGPASFTTYPEEWVARIAHAGQTFFNNTTLTEDDIFNMTCGEESEVLDTYGSLLGYQELSDTLNDYFENGMYK